MWIEREDPSAKVCKWTEHVHVLWYPHNMLWGCSVSWELRSGVQLVFSTDDVIVPTGYAYTAGLRSWCQWCVDALLCRVLRLCTATGSVTSDIFCITNTAFWFEILGKYVRLWSFLKIWSQLCKCSFCDTCCWDSQLVILHLFQKLENNSSSCVWMRCWGAQGMG